MSVCVRLVLKIISTLYYSKWKISKVNKKKKNKTEKYIFILVLTVIFLPII